VLLNKNARKVNARMVDRIKKQAPHADIFVTQNMVEAEQALSKVANGRYDICFTGGGDGTVCHAVTRLSELSTKRSAPPIGVLPLGTGNAIASYLESPNVDACVQNPQLAQKDSLSFPEMTVITEQGQKPITPRKAAFGGFGWDSFVLDRYFKWRDICKNNPILNPIGEGLLAYLIAGLGWAVPELLIRQPRWKITVRNGSDEALQVTNDGQILKRIAPGELIYQGHARLFSFGTCPFFGFRMKALPLAATTSKMMQVRIADFSPMITALYLPKIWKGKFTHPKLWDFLVSDFEVTLSSETALQMGGDVIGRGKQFAVNMTKPAQVLRFGEYQGLKQLEDIP
jgi:diacylglycerol kinase family enzyme